MSEQKPYTVESTINAAAGEVWDALTRPELIREWFGWDYEGIEAEIQFIFVEHATPLPPHRIDFTDGQHIELVPDGDRTVVRVVMAGDLDGADWDDVYDGMEEGWRTFFEQLRFFFERRPAGRRRTIFLSGEAGTAELLAVLAQAESGQLWHKSRFQQMAVDPTGHLVGVAAQRVLDESHSAVAGPVSVTVSTYGLDDAAFAELRERWEARWWAVARDPEVTVWRAGTAAAGPPH